MNKATATLLMAALVLVSCRGTKSGDPPIHLNLNMDYQERFDPQEANPFFADNRSMRPLVPGTVARGMLRDDVVFYEGRTRAGGFVDRMPVPTTRELLARGQERYNIYCTVCHGEVGDGEGIVTAGGYGYTPAPSYHTERLRGETDGYMYDVIANGVRTMPPYGHQVPPADRWAIVAYIRALQRSQYANPDDVPANLRADVAREAARGGGVDGAESEDAPAGDSEPGGAVDQADEENETPGPEGDNAATGGNE